MLNSLITECIDHLAYFRRGQVTGPSTPLGVRALQAERNQLNPKAYDDNNQDPWLAFRLVKNEIKSVTTEKRIEFLCRAVSPLRWEVWRVINVCSIQVAEHCKWTQIN